MSRPIPEPAQRPSPPQPFFPPKVIPEPVEPDNPWPEEPTRHVEPDNPWPDVEPDKPWPEEPTRHVEPDIPWPE